MNNRLTKIVIFILLFNILLMQSIIFAESNLAINEVIEEDIIMNIETPNDSVNKGNIEITGWIVSKLPIEKVEIVLDDTTIGSASYGIEREDILEIYPTYGDSLNSGFYYELNSNQLSDGEYLLEVQTYDTEGKQHYVSKNIVINNKNSDTPVEDLEVNEEDSIIKEGINIPESTNRDSGQALNIESSDQKVSGIHNTEVIDFNVQEGGYVGTEYKLTSNGSSLNGVEYKYYLRNDRTGRWTVLQEYSGNNTHTWVPTEAGKYRIVVHVRDKNSTETVEAYGYKDIEVSGRTIVKYTEYNIGLEEMVAIQANSSPRTDEYNRKIAYVSSEYISRSGNTGTVTATIPLNVRLEPNTRITALGTLEPGDTVTILGTEQDTVPNTNRTWYAIEYNHNQYWQFARPADISNRVDPEKARLDENESDMYQFLVLSETSGVGANYLNNELQGKGKLTGTGSTFIEAAETYGINEFYLLSHAILETGHGSSSLSNGEIRVGRISENKWVSIQRNGTFIAELIGTDWTITKVENFNESDASNIRVTYNMFGIGAVDRAPETLGSIRAYREGWDTPEKGIIGGVRFISQNYVHHPTYKQDTLYKMRWNPATPGKHQYATDIGWAYKQTSSLFRHYQANPHLRKTFDIPRYN